MDEKYHVTYITKFAATVAGIAAIVLAKFTRRAAAAAGNAVANRSYFAEGALWVSDMLTLMGFYTCFVIRIGFIYVFT